MTPRNFGWVTVGTCSPLMLIGSSADSSLLKVVKMVADDFDGEINKFLDLNQASSTSRYALRSGHISSIVFRPRSGLT